MALSYKARRRWSLVVLLVGLPAYIATAWFVTSLFEVRSVWLDLGIYTALGIVWALPLKAVFKGVGQADPDAPPPGDQR
jgi:hypothetical protein